jgi:S-adenosylmethionine-diacylglycerol 3-amino-3-carboxypropyl transferase
MWNWLRARTFSLVHRHNLIYNACWEDPACDRELLAFHPDHRVLVITSAGCNALDYLLAGAGEVHAVDLNPRQNYLLELKAAALQALEYEDFFTLFGKGASPHAAAWIRHCRPFLSPAARRYWTRHAGLFAGHALRPSFYWHGTNGLFNWLVRQYAQRRGLGPAIADLLAARDVAEQKTIYDTHIADRLWTPALVWSLNQHTPYLLLGVPWPQRQEIVSQFPGGTAAFSRWCLEGALTRIPLRDNYFWRVSLTGQYSPDCCPEYLKPHNVQRLRSGLLERLRLRTTSITDYLRHQQVPFHRYILLDHMDWMAWQHRDALADEWSAIRATAAPHARILFRSAGLHVRYLDDLPVQHHGQTVPLGSTLTYDDTAKLVHQRDRTQIYGSSYLASFRT